MSEVINIPPSPDLEPEWQGWGRKMLEYVRRVREASLSKEFLAVGQYAGTLAAATLTGRFYFRRKSWITMICISVGVAPTGGSATFDILLNGSTIFPTGPKPTIPAGANWTQLVIPVNQKVVMGDFLQFTVLTTSGPAADCVFQVWYREEAS